MDSIRLKSAFAAATQERYDLLGQASHDHPGMVRFDMYEEHVYLSKEDARALGEWLLGRAQR